MSVLDEMTTAQPAATVQADADALLLSRRMRVYLSSTAGPYPQVAATIHPAPDSTRRRPWAVTLAHGIWDCSLHQASDCACCLAVQANTTGPAPAVCCAHDPVADHDALGCTARVGFPGMPTTSCDCLTPARTTRRKAGL